VSSVLEKAQELEQNGFVTFQNFLPSEMAQKAHDELKAWYQKDLEERKREHVTEAHHDGCAGHTILTKPSHLMLDVYGKSPTLDKMVDKILTDPLTAAVLKKMVGSDIDFYGYNVRLMTGTYDPAPAHEFHRDSPGEMGIGILLTDVPSGNAAATAVVPGSHMYPYCSRWNTLFKNSCANYHSLTKLNKLLLHSFPFNNILARKINKIATGVSGKKGDVYFFINDTWHGRQPNLEGRETMVLLIGGSSPDMKLHHAIKMPPAELMADLPESIRKAFCDRNKPQNPSEETIIKKMLANRKKAKFLSLFYMARQERRLFDKINSLRLKLRSLK